ncbi:MAG: hypothetical protein IPL50_19280 [Chitinophagaceae bacterium]|nr:hypothetical protein [Chitinophagaceae bacterium]
MYGRPGRFIYQCNSNRSITGTNTATVYAAPTALTVYTVRATDVATGCFTDATAIVNYTRLLQQ